MRVDEFLIGFDGALESKLVLLPFFFRRGIAGALSAAERSAESDRGGAGACDEHRNGNEREGQGTQKARKSITKPRTKHSASPVTQLQLPGRAGAEGVDLVIDLPRMGATRLSRIESGLFGYSNRDSVFAVALAGLLLDKLGDALWI